MSQPLAVTVIGNDRPGIVAAVTKVLYENGCNLEDVSSTILRGHFSMVMIVKGPEDVTADDLEDRLKGVAAEKGLVVTARPVDQLAALVTEATHMVSVYGADHPGIVYRVTEALAASGANVTDLTSRMIGSESEPVYVVMLEIWVPDSWDEKAAVGSLSDDLGVEVSVHPLEADLL